MPPRTLDVKYAKFVFEGVRIPRLGQCNFADLYNQYLMNNLKWGEVPIGSLILHESRSMLVISRTGKSVSLLDMYHNKVVRRKVSARVNVSFTRSSI